MVELAILFGAVKELLKLGIEKLGKHGDFKKLRAAVYDRTKREVKFNLALLDEISKIKGDATSATRIGLLLQLSTKAFEDVEAGKLPLKLFFEGELTESMWPVTTDKRFRNWGNKDRLQSDLLQRVYHRIRVTKSMAAVGKDKSNIDYLHFLLRAFLKSTTSTATK